MNKKLLTILLLTAGLNFSKMPVNVDVYFSNSFNLNKISKEEIENAGLKSLLPEGYKTYENISAIGSRVMYPIPTPYFNVKLGVGADLYVSYNINKYETANKEDKEFNSKKQALKVANTNLETAKGNYQDENYVYTVANNRYLDYKGQSDRDQREINRLDRQIAAHEQAKTEYTQEEVDQMKAQWTELEGTADAAAKKEAEADRKIALYDKMKEENSWLAPFLGSFYQKAYADKKAAHDEYVQALAERKRLFDIIDVADKPDEQIAAKQAKKAEVQKDKEKADIYAEYYKNKKQSSKAIRRENQNIENEKSEEYKLVSSEFYSMLEEAYNKIHDPLEELPKYPKQPSEDDFITEEYTSGSDNPAYTEAENKYYEDLEKYEEKEEEIAERYKLLDAFYDEILENNANYEARKELVTYLNNKITFGSNLYGVVELEREVIDNLKLFSNIKIGAKIYENPLYKITKEFESKQVVVDASEYVKPESVKQISVKPIFDLGVGLTYYGFKAQITTGVSKGFIGLDLGYEF